MDKYVVHMAILLQAEFMQLKGIRWEDARKFTQEEKDKLTFEYVLWAKDRIREVLNGHGIGGV